MPRVDSGYESPLHSPNVTTLKQVEGGLDTEENKPLDVKTNNVFLDSDDDETDQVCVLELEKNTIKNANRIMLVILVLLLTKLMKVQTSS